MAPFRSLRRYQSLSSSRQGRHDASRPESSASPSPSEPATSPNMSAPALMHVPSLDVDYDILDAEDPSFELGWFYSFALFGFSGAQPGDPRHRALAKLHRLTAEHGVGGIRITDYVRAFSVHATMIDRQMKIALQERGCREEADEEHIPMHRREDKVRSFAVRIVRKRPRARPFVSVDSLSDPPAEPLQWSLEGTEDICEIEEFCNRRWSLPERILTAPSDARAKGVHDPSDNQRANGELRTESSGGSLETEASTASSNSASNEGPCGARKVRAEHVQLLYHMLRHAESVYGFPLNMASAPRVSLTRVTDRGIIRSRTGLSNADLKVTSFITTAFMPAHYVAVDRHVKAVVVCVRGTASLVDSLTDFAATCDPIKIRRMVSGGESNLLEGYGHAGVLRSARNLYTRIREPTLSAMRENPDFALFVTGHSLGASIAAALTLIMRDDGAFPGALAFCFAPLPCMTLELAEESAKFTISVVNGPDIVPRLGVSQMLPYIATAQYVSRLSGKRKILLSLRMHNAAIDWEELEEHNMEQVPKLKKKHEGQRLYIPGKVLQLVRKNEIRRADAFRNSLFRRRNVEVVPVPRTHFLEVRSKEKRMFVSHAPYSYKSKLTLVLRGMGVGPLRRMAGGSVFRNLLAVPVGKFRPQNTEKNAANGSLDNLVHRLVTEDGSPIPLWEAN